MELNDPDVYPIATHVCSLDYNIEDGEKYWFLK